MSKSWVLIVLVCLSFPCMAREPDPTTLRVTKSPGPLTESMLEDAGHTVSRQGGVWICRTESRGALWTTLTTALGALQQQEELSLNNLSNYNTTGFKRSEMVYSKARGARRGFVFSQGPLVRTGNPYHVAIKGQGFFRLTLADGTLAYSRDGSMKYKDGNLVLRGCPVADLPADATNIEIQPDGQIWGIKIAGDGKPEYLSRLKLTLVSNPETLEFVGEGLFKPTPATVVQEANPDDRRDWHLAQAHLEGSNLSRFEEGRRLTQAREHQAVVASLLKVLDPELVIPESPGAHFFELPDPGLNRPPLASRE